MCPADGTGRHAGLRNQCREKRGGSNPSRGTKFAKVLSGQFDSVISNVGMHLSRMLTAKVSVLSFNGLGRRTSKATISVRFRVGPPSLEVAASRRHLRHRQKFSVSLSFNWTGYGATNATIRVRVPIGSPDFSVLVKTGADTRRDTSSAVATEKILHLSFNGQDPAPRRLISRFESEWVLQF